MPGLSVLHSKDLVYRELMSYALKWPDLRQAFRMEARWLKSVTEVHRYKFWSVIVHTDEQRGGKPLLPPLFHSLNKENRLIYYDKLKTFFPCITCNFQGFRPATH